MGNNGKGPIRIRAFIRILNCWALTQTVRWEFAQNKWKIQLWDALNKFGLWVIQHSPRTMVVLFAASAFIIFAPPGLLHYVWLDWVKVDHPHIVGPVFLVSGFFSISYPITWLWWFIHRRMAAKKAIRGLAELTNAEKTILQRFILGETKTLSLDPSSGVVRGLEIAGIIFQSSMMGAYAPRVTGLAFAYNMRDWAWKELQKDPTLIET